MNIHSTAVVEKGAEIGEGASIGPYCVIGPHEKIGAGTKLMSHVVVDGWTTIGANCSVFPFASLGTQTQDLKFRGGKTFVEIGDRTTLREYVMVNSATADGEVTRVGSDCHIMAYCHIAHACRVGNQVIMANCATLAGEIVVEDQAIIGGLAAVHQFTRIGRMCMIGGCSAIRQDCPPFILVAGNPAVVGGLNTVALERRNVSVESRQMLKKAYHILYREGLSTRQALEKIRAEVAQGEEVRHFVNFIETSQRGIIKDTHAGKEQSGA
jgi:UDP-N-acetylglucosamine acyltransferase